MKALFYNSILILAAVFFINPHLSFCQSKAFDADYFMNQFEKVNTLPTMLVLKAGFKNSKGKGQEFTMLTSHEFEDQIDDLGLIGLKTENLIYANDAILIVTVRTLESLFGQAEYEQLITINRKTGKKIAARNVALDEGNAFSNPSVKAASVENGKLVIKLNGNKESEKTRDRFKEFSVLLKDGSIKDM